MPRPGRRDGAPGPTGEGGFAAEKDRYHLYVSYACPWAHRTLIFRSLKNLDNLISVSVTDAKMPDETGWSFTGTSGSTGDALYQKHFLHEIYALARPDYTGRVTVPVLWDKQRQTIVSNESAEIIRMFNSAFNALTGNEEDYYPEPLRDKIKTAWDGILADAALDDEVVRHTLRHTAATWQMQAGTDLWPAAGFLGMTVEQLEQGYAHHHPDFQGEAAGAFGGRQAR